MNSVLFVDDDPMVLQGLRRMLYPMRKEWEMRFASSGQEALAMMDERASDVIVSDMRMPVMSGAQLLNAIKQRHPKTIRMILSGYADTEMILQCVEGTHQFLSKPCDGETLRSAVARALELDRWIGNQGLKDMISQLRSIPSLPELYVKIVQELRSSQVDLNHISALISQDTAMTAKILQLVNSAFFGMARHVSDPADAVVQLGLEMVQSLVLAIHVFSQCQLRGTAKIEMQTLHQHSLDVALAAKTIAEVEHLSHEAVGAAFTAGLLHDIGRLVFLSNFPERLHQAAQVSQSQNISLADAEEQAFGVDHRRVGAYLLGLWGLPIPLVEAAMFHHSPSKCQSTGLTSMAAVHIANAAVSEPRPASEADFLARLDKDFLEKAGLLDHVPAWWRALGPENIR